MKKIVLTYGLISGVIVAALMWLMLAMMNAGVANSEHDSYALGYAIMIISLSLVFSASNRTATIMAAGSRS